MDVAQNGYDMGYKAVEAAVKCLQGETVDAFIDSCALYISALSSLGNTAVPRRYDWERWSVRPDRFSKGKEI